MCASFGWLNCLRFRALAFLTVTGAFVTYISYNYTLRSIKALDSEVLPVSDVISPCLPQVRNTLNFISCSSTNFTDTTEENSTMWKWMANFFNETIPYDIIRYPAACRCESSEVLIGVISNAINAEMRNAIRATYANPQCSSAIKDRLVTVIFVLGAPSNGRFDDIVKEHELHEDLLITSIEESYSNLPLKYKEELCRGVPFLAKTDDDVVVDVDRLVRSLQRFRKQNAIFGNLYDDSLPNRNVRSKWYTPEERYMESSYPEYVGGIFYLVSSDAVGHILRFIPRVRLISVEDVLFTGVIASIAGVRRIDERRSFAVMERKSIPEYWPCDERNEPYLLAEHDGGKLDSSSFRKKFDNLKHIKCSALPFPIFSLTCKYFDICA